MNEQMELKELKEMRKFLKEHPHTKAGQLWHDEFHTLIEQTKGDIIKLAILSFQIGFVRGLKTQKKMMKKEQVDRIRKSGAA